MTVLPTTLIDSARLSRKLGVDLLIASETFQRTGSFKYRAASKVAQGVPNLELITASSGNFGQALALAAAEAGKRCTVVMPANSAQVKVQAVRDYGATVELVDVRVKSRAIRLAELAQEKPEAYLASPYDDALVIEGNASLGRELAPLGRTVIAPVGGGGLTAGLLTGLRAAGSDALLWGAEPLLANDAARSLREGRIVRNQTEPQTLADGARTLSLGVRNFALLEHGLAGIIEVPEEAIAQAVRLLFELANLKSEPTGALSVAALLVAPERFRDEKICCVVSGGNVDAALYATLIG